MNPHQDIINKALEHIQRQQLPDGSFLSLSATDPNDFSGAVAYKTTFFTSNILVALQGQKNIEAIGEKGVTFLLTQKSKRWSFNYLAHTLAQNIPSPYPDDLDDTFVALTAIAHYEPKAINGQALAAITRLLIMLETDPGGPFKTWLVPNDSSENWHDIDLVVNSNIGYFLSFFTINIPAIEKFIAQRIKNHRLSSPYYPGLYQIIYFISRFYKSQQLAEILSTDLKEHSDRITLLEQAMAISSLINLGQIHTIDQKYLDAFIAQVKIEGFKPYAFCIDPRRNNKRSYAGASALTAALCAEALHSYYVNCVAATKTISPSLHFHIQNVARKQSEGITPELRALVLEQIENTSDKKVTDIAYEVQEALKIKNIFVSDALTENLALANLYGWMAYTIYDDIIDGEGNATLITCANFFMRNLIDIYARLERDVPGVQNIFDATMNSIDGAMAWEQKHGKIVIPVENILRQKLPAFENYSNLADRSLGHALPAFIALFSIGYDTHSEEYLLTQDLFHHYLIARQLHDDAHDWEDDLLRGNINSVCALLLKNFQEKYCAQSSPISLAEALPELRRIFWEEIIDNTTDLILFHIAAAQEAKRRSLSFNETDFMEKPLQILQENARKIVAERDKTIEFLNYYLPSSPYSHNP